MSFTTIVGEFGVVYKAHLVNWQENQLPQAVAVKTVKGNRIVFTL